jgi:hypothetical protein
MRHELLANYRYLIPQIASLLHREWGALAPWRSLSVIESRLTVGSASSSAPFTIVALSDTNEFLGTASIKLFELADHADKKHWLGEVFIPAGLRGRGIG